MEVDVNAENPRTVPGWSLVLASVALAALASFVLVLIPAYAVEVARLTTDGAATEIGRGRATLLETEGAGVLRVLLLPIAIAAIPLFIGNRRARLARAISALLLMGFAGVALMSVGVFYLPSAIAMAASAVWKLGHDAEGPAHAPGA
jgi:hypothetical protein